MREIKFRAKARYGGDWIYGALLKDNVFTYVLSGNPKVTMGLQITKEVEEVLPETVGQYTGLKDKNGKMIFEGDVIHVDNYDEGWDSIVEFKGGAFAADVEGKDYDYTAIGWLEYEVEVIGNIHEGATPCTSATVE